MATITKTLRSSGGDYSLMSTWESTEQTDLVTDGDTHVLECYADWGSGLDNEVLVQNWTTDATHYITIKAASGEEHLGVAGAGFYMISGGTFAITLKIAQNYTRLLDIEIRGDTSGSNAPGFQLAATNFTAKRCIFYTLGSSLSEAIDVASGSSDSYFENCVIEAENGVALKYYPGLTSTVYNCTVISHSSSTAVEGSSGGANSPLVKNVVAYSDSGSAFTNSFDGSSDYNAGSDTTAPGANSVDNITTSDFANFAGGDYSIDDTGSAMYDAGVDLNAASPSAGFSDDIAGNTRG